ncbi:MAG: PhoH family protein [Acidobacteriia bacterium]|nr:PhoH family protein [Terriglobia bacterium]
MRTIILDATVLEGLVGSLDETLRLIEERFGVRLSVRGDRVTVDGGGEGATGREERVEGLLNQLAALRERGLALRREDVRTAIGLLERDPGVRLADHFVHARLKPSSKKTVVPKSANQRRYLDAIRDNDLVIAIGPAGTGKTYLAVAMAITLLHEKRVQRIILARPAVEAGERLGFLPGDIAAKVDPYLRPLYDALYDMLEPDRIESLLDRGIIEIAPLAFMRGRTLNDSFVILDEGQNTTSEQMKMFLTRIGFDSKAVVTGDVTQIDLPAERTSGLVEARDVLSGISGIEFVHFDETDVVRHPLVQQIIVAYDRRATSRRDPRPSRNGVAPPEGER